MAIANTLRIKKWYQKKKQDPEFHEEYKKKQRLYYYRRKHKSVIPDYGLANCKYCNKKFKKSRPIHYFCSKSCRRKDFQEKNKTALRIRRSSEEYKLAQRIRKSSEEYKLYQKNYREKLKKENPDKYQQIKEGTKRAQVKYWKKLKDKDPKKYELMLEKTRQATRKWKEKNKDKLKSSKYIETQRRWKKQKIKTDPIYKISERLRSYLSRSIKGVIQKNFKTEKIVGTSFKNLVSHLEKQFKPGMSLSNYGKWHIDHIKPITKYDLTKPGEVEKCFHYSNLQPLWASENIKKSNKY